jgi:hypothetical protein
VPIFASILRMTVRGGSAYDRGVLRDRRLVNPEAILDIWVLGTSWSATFS